MPQRKLMEKQVFQVNREGPFPDDDDDGKPDDAGYLYFQDDDLSIIKDDDDGYDDTDEFVSFPPIHLLPAEYEGAVSSASAMCISVVLVVVALIF